MFLRILQSVYLLVLAATIGAMLACGAFSAPVIFNAGNILSADISQAQSGILMGLIFQKLCYLLYMAMFFILVIELFATKILRHFSIIATLSAGVSVICVLLFNLYYTPYILSAPDSQNAEFASMHAQSVAVYRILMASLAVLFFNRILFSRKL